MHVYFNSILYINLVAKIDFYSSYYRLSPTHVCCRLVASYVTLNLSTLPYKLLMKYVSILSITK